MHTLVISITGLAMVAADPPLDCSLGDYGEGIGWDLDISGVAQCLTTDITVDDWLSCLSDQPVSVDCINGLSANIADNLSVCDTPCESINSTDCRICNGVVAIQQIVVLEPEAPYAMCASAYDRDSIMAVDWTVVAQAGDIYDLFGIANVSEICTLCIDYWTNSVMSDAKCGPACTDSESVDCLNCLNVWWVSSLAFCAVTTWDASCEDSDFVSLTAMDPSIVKGCIETVENDDGLFHCLTNGTSTNLTKDCAATLVGEFDYYDFVGCGVHCTIATSIECANCKGANMFYQTLAYDSVLNGSCGTTEDRNLISEVDPEPVYACGETTPYAGATCIGSAANVSTGCMHCLASRTHHVRVQCSPHCSDATSDDCLECVNIGLLGVAAFCNAHLSGSVGMSGLFFLIGLAVAISMTLLA